MLKLHQNTLTLHLHLSVRSSSKRGLGLELGIEFEDFYASKWELTNCQFADGHFEATKSQLEGVISEVMTVRRPTDVKFTSEFEFEQTKSQPNYKFGNN